jgi:hypothetical protein
LGLAEVAIVAVARKKPLLSDLASDLVYQAHEEIAICIIFFRIELISVADKVSGGVICDARNL